MAAAQQPLGEGGETRTVAGVVSRGGASEPRPLANTWVVLHRVGSDRSGPLDSTRTDARGRYRFRYRTSGTNDALYFASTWYAGIAYFTTPLSRPNVDGDDAAIFVFDTTSTGGHVGVLGHHLVVGAPVADGGREIVEVFDLANDSSVTRVSGGPDRPVWSAPLPEGATDVRVNPGGEIGARSVESGGGRVRLYAPLSPGGRQFSYSYQLADDALPLRLPLEGGESVLEVLLEEPRAMVSGAPLDEVAPVTVSGRLFRRYLGHDVPRTSVLTVSVAPPPASGRRIALYIALAGVAAMAAGIAIAERRRRRRAGARVAVVGVPRAPAPIDAAQGLLRDIVALDARIARAADPAERAGLEAERAERKQRLAARLAGEGGAH